MKILVASLLVSLSFQTVLADNCNEQLTDRPQWEEMTKDEQADILGSMDLYGPEDLPANTKIINFKKDPKKDFDINQIYYKPYKKFVEKMLATFDEVIDTEEFEQTDYELVGKPVIKQLSLLVTLDKQVLGGYLRKKQYGTDDSGDSDDIEWTARLRVDDKAELFRSEKGEYDELYYEWSGH